MAVDNFRFGSWATDDFTKVVVLAAHNDSSGNVSTFMRCDKLDHNSKGERNLTMPVAFPVASGQGYQVPTGKEYVITLIEMGWSSATDGVALAYGDTDVGWRSASFPTNPKSLMGMGGAVYNFPAITQTSSMPTAGESSRLRFSAMLRVPALKYPCAIWTGSAMAPIWLYGFEA